MEGTQIPRMGFGTYSITDPIACRKAVVHALEYGYRHVDTAQSYGNEEAVGAGIAAAPVDRDEVFIASKVSSSSLGYDEVIESTMASRDRLGIQTIDLMYVHWPSSAYIPDETLPALLELRDMGVIEHIGVSNFEPAHLDEAIDILDGRLLANQVEMHPLCPQSRLLDYAQEHDHWVVAYSPIARGEIFGHPTLRSIADKHDISLAQVCLSWVVSKDNVAAIPKSATPSHIEENFDASTIELDAEDYDAIESIESRHRVVDPVDAPWNR